MNKNPPTTNQTPILPPKSCLLPDLGEHEVVDALSVLLLDRGWINECFQILVHQLSDKWSIWCL